MGARACLPLRLCRAWLLHNGAPGAASTNEARNVAGCDWCVLEPCRCCVDLECRAGIRTEVVFHRPGCEFTAVCMARWKDCREKVNRETGNRGTGEQGNGGTGKRGTGKRGTGKREQGRIHSLNEIHLNHESRASLYSLFPVSPVPV